MVLFGCNDRTVEALHVFIFGVIADGT